MHTPSIPHHQRVRQNTYTTSPAQALDTPPPSPYIMNQFAPPWVVSKGTCYSFSTPTPHCSRGSS